MPFNGQGVFAPKHTWVTEAAQGTAMLPANFDDQDADMAAGLSNAILRDGSGGPTADIPWKGYGITGMRDPVAAQEAATKNYVDVVDASTRTWVQANTTALPNQSGNAGKFLQTNGSAASWQLAYPDQTNNAGKALMTDGTSLSWQQIYPAQANNAGKVLVTSGTATSWSASLSATVLRFADGADATKLIALDASSIATGTTRTVTVPNKSGTMAMLADLVLPTIYVREEYAPGTAGPQVSNGSIRALNTVAINTIAGASLSNGMITLPAGTYDFEGNAGVFGSSVLHRIVMYTSDYASGIAGTNEDLQSQATSHSVVRGRVSWASGTKQFMLYQVLTAQASGGIAINGGFNELYSELLFRKIA